MKKKAGVNSKQWEATRTRTYSSTIGAHTNLKLPVICRPVLPSRSLFTIHFEVRIIEGRDHACFMIQHGLNKLRCSIAQRVHVAAKPPHLHLPTSRRHALGHRLPLALRPVSAAAVQKKATASKSDLLVSATIRERLAAIADTLSDVENHGDWKGMEDEIATLEQKLQVRCSSHSACKSLR